MRVTFGIDLLNLALPINLSFDNGELGFWNKSMLIHVFCFFVMFIWD